MNSCVLTAQVVEAPKLRYTQDNQTPVADMFVEFAGGREDDPPSRLRVVGWNNLATEI
ncbi:MAG: single-stranded DNA-binding protein, partial [Spirulinaceae cyanobacterium RM2_2_10]|nr:single-stranded DNA-binding protein [Spirulinaceae cyanobacterium RM2_2_10]